MIKKEPLYVQITEIIKNKILKNEYKVGDNIPTETELEKEFCVSRITIRKAIEALEADGYVEKKSGKGTKVISNNLFNKLSKAESFSSVLASKGHKIKKKIISYEVLENKENSEQYLAFGKKCNKITRIYYMDQVPYIFFEHFLPINVEMTKEKINDETSLYMHLYKEGVQILSFEDEFFVEHVDEEIIKELNLDEDIVLGRKRKTYNLKGKVVEISIAKYNSKIHNYVIKYEI